MEKENKKEIKKAISFDSLLTQTASLPLVRIDRENFLRAELKKYCDEEVIQVAIDYNPAFAGISNIIIDRIANSCIAFETGKVSVISTAAGIPGGYAMIATIPADITQYFAHVLRIMQKLVYLYGWEDLLLGKDEMDDETRTLLTMFVGVMFGVKGATDVIGKVSLKVAENVGKKLSQKALTKGIIYPIVKKVAKMIGIQMTKEIFAKGVSKVVPIIGGVVSGGVTFVSFYPMARKFKKYLSGLNPAKKSYYENNTDKKIIETSEIFEITNEAKETEKELSEGN